MPQIVLDPAQAEIVTTAVEPVAVCDATREVLGYIDPLWTRSDIVEAKRRLASDQPRYTTAQVIEHL